MGYLTERKLSNTLDAPVSLAASELKMGDWLVISTIVLTEPSRVIFRMLNLNFISSTLALSNILPVNLVTPNFGLLYIGLFANYISGDPSSLPALDVVSANNFGVAQRTAPPVVISVPGTYSWIAVNNVQFNNQNALLSASDSADFTLNVVGQARLELDLSQ